MEHPTAKSFDRLKTLKSFYHENKQTAIQAWAGAGRFLPCVSKGGEIVEQEKDKNKPSYTPIPNALLVDKALTDSELRYYAIIVSLSYARGYCFMSNRQLGERLGKSIRTMQRIIDGLKEKGYVQVHVYTDDEGHIHREIIPLTHVKTVMGHAIFDTGNDKDDMGVMPDLSRPPCQNWHHSNNKMSNNKISICANQDLHRCAPSQKSKTERGGQSAKEERFSEFWQAYPKKRNKARAKQAFFRIKNIEKVFPVMMQALRRQKASADWQKDGGQYIPLPTTWLNGERWEDVEQVEVQPPASGPVVPTAADLERRESERQQQLDENMNELLERMKQEGEIEP